MKTQRELVKDLKSEFTRYGVTLKAKQIDQVKSLGVDTFLNKQGVPTISKDLTLAYIIVNEYRNIKSNKI